MTTAPAAAKRGAHSREVAPPAENRARSNPAMVSSRSGATTPTPGSSRPAERSEANGTISLVANSRAASTSSMIRPTAPVAPTTATRGAPLTAPLRTGPRP